MGRVSKFTELDMENLPALLRLALVTIFTIFMNVSF
ncbi:hypothetical protein Syn7502_00686 [Synechococcus sp. PCC 7502]|nr:hypothetical protein Syn7502_00686 [Synechococcus sp. PCC 7502]